MMLQFIMSPLSELCIKRFFMIRKRPWYVAIMTTQLGVFLFKFIFFR